MMKDFKDREVDCAITFEDFIDKKVLVHAIPTGGNAKDGLFTGEPSGITYGFATVEDYYKYAHWWNRAAFCSDAIEKANTGLENSLKLGRRTIAPYNVLSFDLPAWADNMQLNELVGKWLGEKYLEYRAGDLFEPTGFNAKK